MFGQYVWLLTPTTSILYAAELSMNKANIDIKEWSFLYISTHINNGNLYDKIYEKRGDFHSLFVYDSF